MTGLSNEQLTELVTRVHAARGGGFASRGRPHALRLFGSVALVVCLMRKNITQAFAGAIFGVSQPTVSRRWDLLRPLIGQVLAECVPDLAVRDGVLDSRTDLLKAVLNSAWLVVSSPPGDRLNGTISIPSTRHSPDQLPPRSQRARLELGGDKCMGVMTGPVHRDRADRRQPPAQRGGNLDIHPGHSGHVWGFQESACAADLGWSVRAAGQGMIASRVVASAT